MKKFLPLTLLMLAACPDPAPQPVVDYSDPNHPVVMQPPSGYAPQPSGGGFWQNLASGGVGYMLGRMHSRPATEHAPNYAPPAPRPAPSYSRPSWFSRPAPSYTPTRPGYSGGGYSKPSYSAPSRPSGGYSRPSGGSRYSGGGYRRR